MIFHGKVKLQGGGIMEDNMIKGEKVLFNYKVNETKYYLLTGGSGYPLAEFNYPYLNEHKNKIMIVPKDRVL